MMKRIYVFALLVLCGCDPKSAFELDEVIRADLSKEYNVDPSNVSVISLQGNSWSRIAIAKNDIYYFAIESDINSVLNIVIKQKIEAPYAKIEQPTLTPKIEAPSVSARISNEPSRLPLIIINEFISSTPNEKPQIVSRTVDPIENPKKYEKIRSEYKALDDFLKENL